MAFKTTALAGDGVRETGAHGHIDDAGRRPGYQSVGCRLDGGVPSTW